MTRTTWLIVSVLMLGCGAGNQESSFAPPPVLNGAGALEGFESVSAEGVPENIRAMGLEQAYVARYSGEISFSVNFYLMKNEPSAFELVQKWRPAAGKLAFYSGPWFVIVESPGADNATLSTIANGLEVELVSP